MTRINLILLVFVCMLVGVVHAQNVDDSGATIRGEVIDTSPQQRPIKGVTVKIVDIASEEVYIITTDKNGFFEKKGLPAGRYTISVFKRGYGDRIRGSKVVADGGEIFDRIKMRKQENIFTFLFDIYQYFIIGVIIAFILIYTGIEL